VSKELEEELYNIEQQEDLTINTEKLKVVLKNLANWKATGPDGIHGCAGTKDFHLFMLIWL